MAEETIPDRLVLARCLSGRGNLPRVGSDRHALCTDSVSAHRAPPRGVEEPARPGPEGVQQHRINSTWV